MATTASLHKNKKTTLGRIKCFISKGPLSKNPVQQNKICGGIPSFVNRVYPETWPFARLEYWSMPGKNGSWQNYSFQEIKSQTFLLAKLGQKFGPIWSTHWLKVTFEIPGHFGNKEIHLRFNSGGEAMLWDENGQILGAFSPEFRNECNISPFIQTTQSTFYIEMACNGMFGGGMTGENLDIGPPNDNYEYTLQQLEMAVFDPTAFKLLTDLEMLYGIATTLPDEDQRGYQAMFTANEMINLIIENNFFHIDTAWLWPYDETIRKCARSWHSQIQLMKEYPDFIFTCSQAQQFYWIKKYYPTLYSEIKKWVKTGNFVPVGGTWVEMDGLLPSGESFIRQFFYGQQFFEEEFGINCKKFWLPDTFGYSGQTPQILRHMGIERFLTQKLSWSMVNPFPHHNFIWEGIDGSEVLVHFPPGDSYTMTASVTEIYKSAANSKDKGRANVGAYLFGHGDGGGGPTKIMLERLKRIEDVDGLPKVKLGTPDQFFSELSKEKDKLCKWVGELYLELHNGTYTSQAKIKWYNRKLEQFLMEVELMIAIAYSSGCLAESQIKRDVHSVDKCWKRVLLNQFHDVIPGSCIELVKENAWRIYKSVWKDLTALKTSYNCFLLGESTDENFALFNPLSWPVSMVICSSNLCAESQSILTQNVILDKGNDCNGEEEGRKIPNQFSAVYATLEASGFTKVIPSAPENPATAIIHSKSAFKFSNGKLVLTVDATETGKIPTETLSFVGNTGDKISVFKEKPTLVLFDDVPLFWDAWDCMDYHLETKKELNCFNTQGPEIVAEGPLFLAYRFSGTFGNNQSSFTRFTIMRANSSILEYLLVIDWKEDHKFLKAEFPLDILTREATYEIQFGHLKRPTHTNTSWDMAKFEVSGQKWIDVSQSDWGVAFITDSKYGWHVRDNIVQLSLLRSPKSPDGNCDMHRHFIHYAVLPHEGSLQEGDVIRGAYEFNFLAANDLHCVPMNCQRKICNNWITSSSPAVVIETVKVASALNRMLCIRMYESFGGSSRTTVMFGFSVVDVQECNGLEKPLQEESKIVLQGENNFEIKLKPFEIKSFLVKF